MVKELSDGVTETQILRKLWKKWSLEKIIYKCMIMMWERYCNASPKPEFFLFSLFVFSFISQLIWVRLHWNFHRWFSIQKQVNWCTIDPFSLKFCTSQHSYPVPLNSLIVSKSRKLHRNMWQCFISHIQKKKYTNCMYVQFQISSIMATLRWSIQCDIITSWCFI